MNKTSTSTPTNPSNTNPIRVLKIGKCDSFSGKSRLTYQLGSKTGKDAYIRITGNTGTGFYSQEWISMDDVETCIKGKAITSTLLFPLFKGKSVNTVFFMLAALNHEEVVQPGGERKRTYEVAHPEYLRAEVKRLFAAGVNLEAGSSTAKMDAPAKQTPKPVAKSPTKAATAVRKAKPGTKKTPKAKKK